MRAKKLEQDRKRVEFMEHFEIQIKTRLTTTLQELLQRDVAGQLAIGIPTRCEQENAVQKIRNHLKNMEIDELAMLIITLDACNNEMRRRLTLEEQCIYFIYLITTYMFDDLVSWPFDLELRRTFR